MRAVTQEKACDRLIQKNFVVAPQSITSLIIYIRSPLVFELFVRGVVFTNNIPTWPPNLKNRASGIHMHSYRSGKLRSEENKINVSMVLF